MVISSLKLLQLVLYLFMDDHKNTGTMGEKLAGDYLASHGYSILHMNWRYANWEIDIIANKSNIIHFVEVKTRRTNTYGYPEDDVSKKKLKNLVNAAEEFLYQFPRWKMIQFDIISVTINYGSDPEILLIEDVYL